MNDDIKAVRIVESLVKRNVPRSSRREDARLMRELNDPVMEAIIEDLNYKYWAGDDMTDGHHKRRLLIGQPESGPAGVS